jgi:hypothetical protein
VDVKAAEEADFIRGKEIGNEPEEARFAYG